CLQGYITPFTF
nr:immunoglobulin light chain junction region [Macaca mulatta]MOW41112.1 immunoglobulin light chain junction region [Macaca mulatta]MOW43351.1 immunoglobulin light chain junction region [Macaca mulatta]MOW43864.1 immunoglobulin light chain junction region [Macaca mulatta]MOW44085.1 immunoglobulin light chain junction region [Macaca mulatta]